MPEEENTKNFFDGYMDRINNLKKMTQQFHEELDEMDESTTYRASVIEKVTNPLSSEVVSSQKTSV